MAEKITNSLIPKETSMPQVSSVGFLSAEKEAKNMEIAMITAKRFPRDLSEIEMKIEKFCSRERFAMKAEYSFPRAGETISGPSISLLKAVAQCYGNIKFGINELYRNVEQGYSECEAFAWDFENNITSSRQFRVPHFRDTKKGKVRVTEDRDIREVVFNFGSRNVRGCLESVIDPSLLDYAREICNKTMNQNGKGLSDRIDSCKAAFKEYDIDVTDLEKIVGEKTQNWNKGHINTAIKYFNALKSGETTRKELLENSVKTISRTQIAEITSLIGDDKSKIDILKRFGYSVATIGNIAIVEYDKIKETISGGAKAEDDFFEEENK